MARLKLKMPKKAQPNKGMYGTKAKRKDRMRSSFLPDNEHLVRMIAMRGATDDEIADTFGVSRTLFQRWRKAYPGMTKAIEDGRTSVDADMLYSLYKEGIGYKYEEEQSTAKGGVVAVSRYARPSVDAIKYWLNNRQNTHWKTAQLTRLAGGGSGEDPIGMKVESRNELIDAICAMIAPKPDGATKPTTTDERVKR